MLKYLLFILLLVRLSASAQPVTLTCFDLLPGSLSSVPQFIASCNGKMLFTCEADSTFGRELWISDGTLPGTHLLKDIHKGSLSSWPSCITGANDKVFFIAVEKNYNSQLWVSDGTEAGTRRITNIDTNNINGGVYPPLAVQGGRAFFWGSDSTHRQALWVSDGTVAGTELVLSFNNADNAAVTDFVAYQGKMCFMARYPTGYTELWSTDGTAAGSTRIDTLHTTSLIYQHLVSCNNLLFFMGEDNAHGLEAWVSDGTAAGTHMITDLNAGPAQGYLGSTFYAYNGRTYFFGDNGQQKGLYSTDGTAAGTQFITTSVGAFGWDYTTVYKDKLYFIGDSAAMCVTNGTKEGTYLLRDSAGYLLHPYLLHEYKGSLYILTAEGWRHGLYRTSGNDTVETLKQGLVVSPWLYYVKQFYEYDDALWINDWLDSSGAELWRIYDTTTIVKNPIQPFAIYPNPNHGSFTISTADSNFIGRIHICDVAGREVYYNNHVSGATIQVTIPGAAAGVYFLTMQDISDPKTSRTISAYKIVVW